MAATGVAGAMSLGADTLPHDVLLKIFSYCSYNDLVTSVQFVCTWWQEVSRMRCLWKHIVYRPRSEEEAIHLLKISPQLQAIDLVSHYNHTYEKCIIGELHKFCPELKRLDVSTDVFSALHDVPGNVLVFPNIKVLILTQGYNDFRSWEFLSFFFPHLEHFEFHECSLTKKDLVSFLGNMQHQLHTLCLPCRTFDMVCVLPYLSACTKLETLWLVLLCEDAKQLIVEEAEYLRKVPFLTIDDTEKHSLRNYLIIFSLFSNLKYLQLSECDEPCDELFQVVSKNCPKLEKLTLSASNSFDLMVDIYQDLSLAHLHYVKTITSLTILYNGGITCESLAHLQFLPHLAYLELYDCEQLTGQCLKVVYGFDKLEILKFDLQYKEHLVDLTASHVKNKNLMLMFYRCRDFSKLEYLRSQHLNISLLADRLGDSLFHE